MKIALDKKGAAALRDMAGAITTTISNIDTDTRNIMRSFKNHEDAIGNERDSIEEILKNIDDKMTAAYDLVEGLSARMKDKADEIEDHL
jgi:methyl-accepting chemotaxis protein